MSQSFRNIRGTFDVLPGATMADGIPVPSSAEWRLVEERIHEVMARYAAREIRTPVLEPTELIARGVGELTDIVSKEMFSFTRGDTNYVLRPEITAPVMRSYLQHHLGQAGGVQRLYYIGPCFRAERPQKGRYRQFHQFGLEILGTGSATADAETIAAMVDVYQALDVMETRLRINTLGDETSRPRYREALRSFFEPYRSDLTETSRGRLDSNPLRILDTKVPFERELLGSAPQLIDFVDADCREHFDTVKSLLDDIGLRYEVDPLLVRGLDYYTRTAFELESPLLGAQSALAGGGRYDLLATELGAKEPVAAVGFAAGFERLFLARASAGGQESSLRGPDAFLITVGQGTLRAAFRLARELRLSGVATQYDFLGRSMKSQMREADRSGARVAVILGESELEEGVATVKNLTSGEQSSVPLEDLSSYFKDQLS